MSSRKFLHVPMEVDAESSGDFSVQPRRSGVIGLSCRKLTVAVGLMIASVAMAATVFDGKITAFRTTADDVVAISQLSEKDTCLRHVHATLTKVQHSNLGGTGPDTGDEQLIYEAQYEDPETKAKKAFLLVIEASKPIETTPERNGVAGEFGLITTKSDKHIGMTWRLLGLDKKPLNVPELMVTFYDLDMHAAGHSIEYLKLDGFSKYWLTENSQLNTVKVNDETFEFRATKAGDGSDNPTDPLKLTALQMSKSVTVQYIKPSEFYVELGSRGAGESERWFNFVLKPALLCAETDGEKPIVNPAEGPAAEEKMCSVVSKEPSYDKKKCVYKSSSRAFKLTNGKANEADCVAECEKNDKCVAFSLLKGKWCIGCFEPLTSNSDAGVVGYSKKQLYCAEAHGNKPDDQPKDGPETCPVVVKEPSYDNKKCVYKSSVRPFVLRYSDVNEADCVAACYDSAKCVAMSMLEGHYCIGCSEPLADAADDGVVGYIKKQVEKKGVKIGFVRDKSKDGGKCRYNSDVRPFVKRGREAKKEDCEAACKNNDQCVAMSAVYGNYCIGCSEPLEPGKYGTTAYSKKEICVPV